MFSITVVPGAAVIFFEDSTGSVFGGKNAGRVDGAPKQNICVFQKMVNGLDEGSHSVNGEHPHGCPADELLVLAGKNGMKAGPEALKAPAVYAAFNKVLCRVLYFHDFSLFSSIVCDFLGLSCYKFIVH